jgi:glycerophosphoryl diester phosphodiesterase
MELKGEYICDIKEKSAELNDENIYDIIERTGGYPVHCAHRGGGDDFGPENTMHSYLKCVEYQVRLIEIDLRLTKDMCLVLMHDNSVDRTTNGKGLVSDYTLEELLKLDAAYNYPNLRGTGIKVPTFKEFLDKFAPIKDLLFMFDFKDALSVEKTLEFVRPYNIANRFILGAVFEEANRSLFSEVHHIFL